MMIESSVWVDTDFGFDDLWALLLLRHLGVGVAGVSLVAGNTPLRQVHLNAGNAKQCFDFDWPLYSTNTPDTTVEAITAEHILGGTGMRSRGESIPTVDSCIDAMDADNAFDHWLQTGQSLQVLALGPLTNIARYLRGRPKEIVRDIKITWMGGSAGRGNQTAFAEFNAFADPESVRHVLESGVALDVIDLQICREVNFSEADIPAFDDDNAKHRLLRDLLGGYLDIALERGRTAMNIYDPVAALALAQPSGLSWKQVDMQIDTGRSERRAQTTFSDVNASCVRLATSIHSEHARKVCMMALLDNRQVSGQQST